MRLHTARGRVQESVGRLSLLHFISKISGRVTQADLELAKEPRPVLNSQVLGLQASATMPSFILNRGKRKNTQQKLEPCGSQQTVSVSAITKGHRQSGYQTESCKFKIKVWADHPVSSETPLVDSQKSTSGRAFPL